YLAQLEALLPEPYFKSQHRENLRIQILLKIQLEFLCYYNKSKIYKELVTHLAIIKKEMPTRKNTLHKVSKEFIKKFSSDKNKDKNHKPDKDKNSQSFSIQLKNKFKCNEYFDREYNYYHKHGYKSQDCHMRIWDIKNKDK